MRGAVRENSDMVVMGRYQRVRALRALLRFAVGTDVRYTTSIVCGEGLGEVDDSRS